MGGMTEAASKYVDTTTGWGRAPQSLTAVTVAADGVTITKAGVFTETWAAGDRIRITAGTNVTAGYYTVASKTSNDVIVITSDCTTDTSSHNDLAVTLGYNGLAATPSGELVGPYTLKTAMAESTAGDVYNLADGTYTLAAAPNDWLFSSETPASTATFQSTSGNPAACKITSDGSGSGSVYIFNSNNIAFRNITIDDGGLEGAALYLRTNSATNVTATFTNCPIIASGTAGVLIVESSTGTVTATFTNCNLTVSGTATGLYPQSGGKGAITWTGGTWANSGTGFLCLEVDGSGLDLSGVTATCSSTGGFFRSTLQTTGTADINIHGNTVTSTSNNASSYVVRVSTTAPANYTGWLSFYDNAMTKDGTDGYAIFLIESANKLKIYDNTLICDNAGAAGTKGGVNAIATAASNHIYVADNTITGRDGCVNWAIIVSGYWTNTYVVGNTVTSASNSAAMHGIRVGADAATEANVMGQVVVCDNTLAVSGTTTLFGHGFLIGSGADGTEFYNNEARLPTSNSAAILGLVVKCERSNIHHNIIRGYQALYLKGGGKNKIYNNVIIASYGNGIKILTDTDVSKDNVIYNNIIDASAGAYTIFSETAGHFNNRYDYNCYQVGSSGLATFDNGATAKATLATVQAYWAELTDTVWTDNDTNSISVTPQYLASTVHDYRVYYDPRLLGAPDIYGNRPLLGSSHPNLGGPIDDRQRYSGYRYGWRP
jgi:hypothetical protein